MRAIALLVLACTLTPAQITILDPNISVLPVTTGIPGVQHQIGSDATGAVYVAEEVGGGFAQVPIHRVSPTGALTPNWLSPIFSAGQMVRNPADGRCYLLHHWQGALEHNHIARIETSGTLTFLHDVLWGVGHGFALDQAGDWFVGTSGTFQAQQIYRIPAGQLGISMELPWSPGPAQQGANAWLAPDAPGVLLCADGVSVWRVPGGGAITPVYTHVPTASYFQWRGLLRSPFGPGHVASHVEGSAGPTTTIETVIWFAGTQARPLLSIAVNGPGDAAIADDGSGNLLLVSQGTLYRVSLAMPPLTAPGQLVAPTTHPVLQPLTVTLTGRPFALSPIALAIDLPLGPPLFPAGVLPIPPYGNVHTSLGILPTFFAVRDGIGAFRPPEPGSVLLPDGTWSETYTGLSPALANTTIVVQGYVLDAGAPNGLLWITPPVFLTFL